MSYTINNTDFRYQSEKIIVELDEVFTGSIGDKVNIKNVISQRTVYDYIDTANIGTEDPFFDANAPNPAFDIDANMES